MLCGRLQALDSEQIDRLHAGVLTVKELDRIVAAARKELLSDN
jgi:hypothetical protein